MVIIFDPNGDRFRDTDNGQFAQTPCGEEERTEFTATGRYYGRTTFIIECFPPIEFEEWCAEVKHRLANRSQAGADYDIITVCIEVEKGDIPTDDDFLILAQAQIAKNRLAFEVKSISSME